jgi:hypothetical protein
MCVQAGHGLTPPTSAPGLGSPSHICIGTGLTPTHVCTGTGLAPLRARLPHLHRDWARPSPGTPATPAPGLGSPLSGHACHICTGTGLAPLRGLGSPHATPAPGLAAYSPERTAPQPSTHARPANRPEHLPRRIPQLCNGTPHTHAMARRTPLAKVDRGLPMQAAVCFRPRASALCGLFPFPMDVLAARKYTRC